jgi:hypothetical protein
MLQLVNGGPAIMNAGSSPGTACWMWECPCWRASYSARARMPLKTDRNIQDWDRKHDIPPRSQQSRQYKGFLLTLSSPSHVGG